MINSRALYVNARLFILKITVNGISNNFELLNQGFCFISQTLNQLHMKLLKPTLKLMIVGSIAFLSCNNEGATDEKKSEEKKDSINAATENAAIKEEEVSYTAGGTESKGYVAYDASKQGKLPIVLVVHEWWGLVDYPRMRAKQLAQLGYLAMAVDMFGNGKI